MVSYYTHNLNLKLLIYFFILIVTINLLILIEKTNGIVDYLHV